MNTQTILAAIKAAIGLRNQCQAAISARAHVLPATAAVPATATGPAIPAVQELATGQLPIAAGLAHQMALNLLGHLQNIEADPQCLAQAKAIIATVAPVAAPAAPAA